MVRGWLALLDDSERLAMARTNSKNTALCENGARQLNALADSIRVHNSIDGKVADLFREAAMMMRKTGSGMELRRSVPIRTRIG
jgi:hypothetical protein